MAVVPVTTPSPRPKEKPGFLYRPIGAWTVRGLTFLSLLVVWQLYARNLNKALGAPPTRVAEATWRQVVTHRTIYLPLESSLTAFFLGFAISVALGIVVGVLMGRWRSVEYTLDPYVSFLYALPHVAFVPIMVFWLGFNLEFRLAYVVLSAIFPVIINTMAGVRNVDPELIAVGESFCVSERQLLRTIILPSTTPYIVAGARQAFSAAWVGVVVAEVLSTGDGLGGEINKFADQFLTADMYVPILFIMFIATVIQVSANYLQARLTPWSASAQRARTARGGGG